METFIKFDVSLTKKERAAFKRLIACEPKADPRKALMAVLFAAISNGENRILELRKLKQEVYADTELGQVLFQTVSLENVSKEFEAKWIEKHARLKTAINTVLDTYLQGESK